jgi:hypothetical protein
MHDLLGLARGDGPGTGWASGRVELASGRVEWARP